MAIKCITLDLDRTTLNSQGMLEDTNKKQILAAIDAGIEVVVASGRSYRSLPKEILELPGIHYAITSNGARIYELASGTCIHEHKMTPQSVLDILEWTKDVPCAYEVFIDGEAYGQKEYVEDPVSYGAIPKAIPYIQSTRIPIPNFVSFIKEHIEELDGLDVIVNGEERKQEIWKLLQKEVPEIYITSSVEQLLEISYKDSGKHSGAAYMLKLLGYTEEELAAFGDGDNDADMLKMAKLGFAVENASRWCKESADRVVASNDAHGVAEGIRYILDYNTGSEFLD